MYLAEKKNGYSNSHLGIVRVKPTKQFICPKIVNFIFCLNGLVNTDGVFNRDESVWNESEKHWKEWWKEENIGFCLRKKIVEILKITWDQHTKFSLENRRKKLK